VREAFQELRVGRAKEYLAAVALGEDNDSILRRCQETSIPYLRRLSLVQDNDGQSRVDFVDCNPGPAICGMIRAIAVLDAALPPTPQWDSNSLTLSFGKTVCRHYTRRSAENQFKVLEAFQAADWPRSIESPFGVHEQTLQDTIKDINSLLDKASPIRFAIESRKPVWVLRLTPPCSR
jgi:hypothetical protein